MFLDKQPVIVRTTVHHSVFTAFANNLARGHFDCHRINKPLQLARGCSATKQLLTGRATNFPWDKVQKGNYKGPNMLHTDRLADLHNKMDSRRKLCTIHIIYFLQLKINWIGLMGIRMD